MRKMDLRITITTEATAAAAEAAAAEAANPIMRSAMRRVFGADSNATAAAIDARGGSGGDALKNR